MLRPFATTATLGLAVILSACGATSGGDTHRLTPDATAVDSRRYLPRGHAHNDYEQRRPLLGALDRGFASVEVDVVLRDRELYVAHGPEDVNERITLRSAYLDPLATMAPGGRPLYGQGRPPLQLLVDVKTDADSTYAVLHDVLSEYAPFLTSWIDDVEQPGAVTVVISGNRAIDRMRNQSLRYAAVDGRVLDDRDNVGPELMPLVSEDWDRLGPPDRNARLTRAARVVEQMHAEGRRVRFWATPEDEELWASLVGMGVDYIGTDQFDRLDRFLRSEAGRPSPVVD